MKPQVFSWGFLFKIMYSLPKIEAFNQNVLSKYQIYNSLFLTLPFEEITNTGVLLPVLYHECEKGFSQKKNPKEIIDKFFKKMLKQGGRFSIKGEKFYITILEQIYNQKGEIEGVMHNEEENNA